MSCAIKPVVQGELGRYTIATGHTGLEGFNRMPGPRAGVSWLVWCWGIMVTLTLLQVGGMYGGVSQVLNLLVPAVSVNVWVGVCMAITLALLLGGGYEAQVDYTPTRRIAGRDFGSGLSEHEVDFLVVNEWAVTADDILWRRTKLGLRFTPSQVAALTQHLEKTVT